MKRVKQGRPVESFWFRGIDSIVKYSDSTEGQSLKDAMLKFANEPWAQAMSFLMVRESLQPIPQCILHSLFLVQLLCSETDRLEVAVHRIVR